MPRYRRIPQIIEAKQLTPENVDEIARWCGGDIVTETNPRDSEDTYQAINVPTLNGNERLSMGMFIYRDPESGRFVLTGARDFAQMYEPDR